MTSSSFPVHLYECICIVQLIEARGVRRKQKYFYTVWKKKTRYIPLKISLHEVVSGYGTFVKRR